MKILFVNLGIMKNSKKSFILFTTMILLIVFAKYSLVIVENNVFSSNLNKLKYLHLQAKIHIRNIKSQLINNDYNISKITFNDVRFDFKVIKKDENNQIKYYITIKTKDESPIRLVNIVTK